MWPHLAFVVFVLHSTAFAAPAAPSARQLPGIVYTSSDPNDELWTPDSGISPTPQRGQLGASILGPQNTPIELQNADLLAPPTTDNGDVKNFKWPFSLSHNRLADGGWARQQNRALLYYFPSFNINHLFHHLVAVMPLATDIAGTSRLSQTTF